MNNSFEVGDKVEVKDFFGKVIRKTEVTEITGGGNIRVKDYRDCFILMAQREEKVCFGLIEFISTKLRSYEIYLSLVRSTIKKENKVKSYMMEERKILWKLF